MDDEIKRQLPTIDDSPLDLNDDCSDVVTELKCLAAKWKEVGCSLHIRQNKLEEIEANYQHNSSEQIYQVVLEWLKRNYNVERFGEPSWRKLAETVANLDKNVFRCIAIAYKKDTDKTAVENAIPTPIVRTEPKSLENVPPGKEVIFTTTLCVTDQVTWQKDGKDITTTQFGRNCVKRSSLIINNVDKGTYRCVVQNAQHSVTSDDVQLTIMSGPVIQKHPNDQFNCEQGKTATFTVVAVGDNCNFQWQRNAVDIMSSQANQHYVGINSSQLSVRITVAELSCEGHYQCRVTNDAGCIVSNSAQLTIMNPPVIITQPSLPAIKVIHGDDVILRVEAKGTDCNFKWRKDGRTITGDEAEYDGCGTDTLSIKKVAISSEGDYMCVVTNRAGQVTSNSATLSIAIPDLTAENVLERLQYIQLRNLDSKWRCFGKIFFMDDDTLDTISQLYFTEKDCLHAVVRYHLNNDVYASWRRISFLLERDYLHEGRIDALDRIEPYLEQLTDHTLTCDNVYRAVKSVNLETLKEVLELVRVSGNYTTTKERVITCWLDMSPYALGGWPYLAGRLFGSEEEEALNEAKKHFDGSKVTEPSLTLSTLSELLQLKEEQFAKFCLWICLPKTKITNLKRVLSNKHDLLKFWLEQHPAPSWKVVADALYAINEFKILSKVRTEYIE